MPRVRPPALVVPGIALAFAAAQLAPTAAALEVKDELLTIAKEQTAADDVPAGESVGEPAAEDAPVEGEPGPGEAVDVPPDEPLDAEPAQPPPDADKAEMPKD